MTSRADSVRFMYPVIAGLPGGMEWLILLAVVILPLVVVGLIIAALIKYLRKK
jgi:hypothetical protein